VSRRGEEQRFPVLSISIGIATTERRTFRHFAEAVAIATEMKSFTKSTVGSSRLGSESIPRVRLTSILMISGSISRMWRRLANPAPASSMASRTPRPRRWCRASFSPS
jgi:hypothetical protein